MSNNLLESLWARVSANIGDRIDQISELLTQAFAANAESKAARDAAASSATEAASHADRAEQATDVAGLRNEVTQQIADLVDGAPEDLDTIREIAEYAQANREVTDQLNAAIGNKANKSHTHTQAQVTGLSTALSGKSDTGHKHTTSEITDFATEMSKKANASHTHSQSQVTGLTTALDGKADASHTHTTSQVSGLSTALNGKADKTYVNSRPALFSGSGAPPSSIPGAVAGDFWLDESTKELHKITGV